MKPENENEQQHDATTGELTDELNNNQSELGDIPPVPSVEEELSEEQLEAAAGGRRSVTIGGPVYITKK